MKESVGIERLLKKIAILHQSAGQFLEDAKQVRSEGGSIEQSKECVRKALRTEARAAELLKNHPEQEPGRSQLYYNAAKIAYALADLEYAGDLLAEGLRGEPDPSFRQKMESLRQRYQYMKIHGTPAMRMAAESN